MALCISITLGYVLILAPARENNYIDGYYVNDKNCGTIKNSFSKQEIITIINNYCCTETVSIVVLIIKMMILTI